MYYLRGGNPLSIFKQQQLTNALSEIIQIAELKIETGFFFETNEKWQLQHQQQLEKILDIQNQQMLDPPPSSEYTFVVVPRIGTVSPWSSKATEIVHHCGLDSVVRIERGIAYYLSLAASCSEEQLNLLRNLLHDPLTESIFNNLPDLELLLAKQPVRQSNVVPLLSQGRIALEAMNQKLGLALSVTEMDYLEQYYRASKRDPVDAELMMFAQVNSEHCRHKMFNASWRIDGQQQAQSLFAMIKNTYVCTPTRILSAYHDNAAIMEGNIAERLFKDSQGKYQYQQESIDILMKVETHNHPTAICPNPGAATGAGGEIRDETATGRGAKPKAGMSGYAVSNLQLPELPMPWEQDFGRPKHFASALSIMLKAPIGAARFNNEFGRPNLAGYFRTFEQKIDEQLFGFHKPIMIAGGYGNVRRMHGDKLPIPVGTPIIVLGGPSYLIGLGGGAASSQNATEDQTDLDFASVQRANPEMQRRCQEVIDCCWEFGDANPILSIHDVGAGGLSNAIPELVEQSERGAHIELAKIPRGDSSLSPLEVWCNESQERYVLAVNKEQLATFEKICLRENCLYAVVGTATEAKKIIVEGENGCPVDFELKALLGHTPQLNFDITSQPQSQSIANKQLTLNEAAMRILQLPTVASKNFLITIGDRSVGGLTARDQMVGPWQVPVSNCAVTAAGFQSNFGEAMAVGERPPIALIDPAASARMAVAEAITNIAAAKIENLPQVKLSANWMVAGKDDKQRLAIFQAVQTIGMELCPELSLTIPVGKDSVSMQSSWRDNEQHREQQSPLSVTMTAYAPVEDIRKTLTPQWQEGDTQLIFIDLASGLQRLGGSAYYQVQALLGDQAPDVDVRHLKTFFKVIQQLNGQHKILSYHDRSDGGLWATICEMAFSSRMGCEVDLSELGEKVDHILFNEELGAIIQVARTDSRAILSQLQTQGLSAIILGTPMQQQNIVIKHLGQTILSFERHVLQQQWAKTSFAIQKLRDNPETAQQEYDQISQNNDPGLHCHLTFELPQLTVHQGIKPKVAILREQGVNGQLEMAAAFSMAGFECIDVHVNDLLDEHYDLNQFNGLAVCGGFSYGDVLGAGRGWAQKILHHSQLIDKFQQFFESKNTFGLGVCNGCQMLSQLKSLIPGANHWPEFIENVSAQYEARLSLVEIQASPSLLLNNMQGSRIPIVVSHGEGRVANYNQANVKQADSCVSMRYIDHHGQVTETYPANPNGSIKGIAGLCNEDGRFTIMMPHPERVFRTSQLSWHPQNWEELSHWFKMFQTAREII